MSEDPHGRDPHGPEDPPEDDYDPVIGNEPPLDPLPALIAGIDQAIKTMPHLAMMVRSCYLAMVEEGFTEKQAIYLARSFLRSDDEPPDEDK